MKKPHFVPSAFVCTFALFFLSTVSAQDLTVRQIMAEPSIAGMRVAGEKLSPDGSKVAFLWNSDGKMPRDVYVVSTGGGAPQRVIGPGELPVPSASPPPENKLT